MKITQRIVVVLFIFSSTALFAQTGTKHFRSREQTWMAYFNQTRLTNKFGLWLDVQYRLTDNFAERPFQLLLRPAVTYFIKDNLRFNVGYSFINHFPAAGLNTSRPEHRPWQQIWWNQKFPGITVLQWLRFEQRFNRKMANDMRLDGYMFIPRLRYNLAFFVPLKGKEMVANTPFLTLSNEIFFNFGSNVVFNTFDQNRFAVGLGYQISSHLNVQLGYLNVFQQEASGNNYLTSHSIRAFVFHNLDFREEK